MKNEIIKHNLIKSEALKNKPMKNNLIKRDVSLPIEEIKLHENESSIEILKNDFTFIYLLHGSLKVLSKEVETYYQKDDLFLINPGEACQIHSSVDNRFLSICISSGFIHEQIPFYGMLPCDTVRFCNADYFLIKKYLLSVADYYFENTENNLLRIHGSLYFLLDELKKLNSQNVTLSLHGSREYENRLEAITSYLEQNYMKNISLSALAEELFLSPQYLSSFFKKHLHCNFKQHLTQIRLAHATQELSQTSQTVSEIAANCGFGNANILYKNFYKAYHVSPSVYRQKKLVKSEACMNQTTPVLAEHAFEQRISLSITAPSAHKANPVQMVNIGSAKNLLSEKFREQLLLAQNRLCFQYLRLQEVISNSLIPMVMPYYEFSFQNIDAIFSFLYQNNFVPFIEISRLPFEYDMLSDHKSTLYAVSRGNRHEKLFESFLIHCSNKWPMSWLSQWKFELWMPPHSSLELYTEDFRKMYGLIHKHIPLSSIGGLGYHPCTAQYTLNAIMEYFKKVNLPFDFFSAHANFLIKAADDYSISSDSSYYKTCYQELRKTLEEYFPATPFYITEWTSLCMPSLPISQSCFQAAFIAKAACELSDLCELMGYWQFSDTKPLLEEFGNRTYYWGSGLINREGVYTPAFYTFELLHRLGTEMLSYGENYCVVKINDHHFQILVYHYAHFQPDAALSYETTDFYDTYLLFEKRPCLGITCTLTDLPEGTYQITRTLIDQNHGSFLDMLIKEYLESNIEQPDFFQAEKTVYNPDQQYRIRACVPEETRFYSRVANTCVLHADMEPHSVLLWDVMKQV